MNIITKVRFLCKQVYMHLLFILRIKTLSSAWINGKQKCLWQYLLQSSDNNEQPFLLAFEIKIFSSKIFSVSPGLVTTGDFLNNSIPLTWLSPWNRIFLENFSVAHLVKKFSVLI